MLHGPAGRLAAGAADSLPWLPGHWLGGGWRGDVAASLVVEAGWRLYKVEDIMQDTPADCIQHLLIFTYLYLPYFNIVVSSEKKL